jgi:hypothetical protein
MNPDQFELMACDEVAVLTLRIRAEALPILDAAIEKLPEMLSREQFVIKAVDYVLNQMAD